METFDRYFFNYTQIILEKYISSLDVSFSRRNIFKNIHLWFVAAF